MTTTELRNVIVFTLGGGGDRHAAELRWIREVVTLGFVTVIPGAPPGLAGAVNLRGNLMPVLDPGPLLTPGAPTSARQGDPALVVEDQGLVAALRVVQVHEVATCAARGAEVIDGRGRALPLVDLRELLRRAQAATHAVRAAGEVEPDTGTGRARPDPLTGALPPPLLDGDTTLG